MAPACTAGFSALALAVRHRHEEIAEILLSHGADPDQNVDGEKIIVHSAVIGEAPMVKVLLSGNANPDCTTKDGLPLLFFLVALAAMKKKDPGRSRDRDYEEDFLRSIPQSKEVIRTATLVLAARFSLGGKCR